MNRAYSILEIKSFDEGKRTFSGVASTPASDRMGDIVEPKGAQFKLPVPLLWQHDSADPIGWVHQALVTAKGIEVHGEIAQVPDAGALRERLTQAWQMMRARLVRGLSIGFRALEDGVDTLPNGGLRFKRWEWLELSAVTIPANVEATITSIKSADQLTLAGRPPPGVPGAQAKGALGALFRTTGKGHTMKTLQEQLAELLSAKAQKAARMSEITAKVEKGEKLSAEERNEFDGIQVELDDVDDQLRFKRAQIVSAGDALPVGGKSYLESGRAPAIVTKDVDDKFKGQSWTRMVIAKALARMSDSNPGRIAEARWGKTNPRLVEWIKAGEVAGGGTISGEWGTELTRLDGLYTGDFIQYLYGMTLFDTLPLREVPANVTIKGADGAFTGYWVGESQPIPVSAGDYSTVNLRPLKVAALAVISNELIRDSSPSAEMLVRDGLVEASRQKVDSTFFSTTAASSNVSPAGLLNGLTAGTSAGTTADNLRADIAGLYAGFITDKNANGLVFVTTPTLAKQISLMVTDLGVPEFPGMPATLAGDRVFTGDNVGSGDLILMKPSDIYKIGDGGVQVSMSRDAVIEMSSAPNNEGFGPTAAGEALVSMFQTENTAIKIVRSINYAKRRSGAVRYIGDADYGASTSWDNP